MIAAKEATPLPLSRADKRNRSRDTFLCPSSAHHHDTISKNRRAPVAKRERSAERRMPTIAAMQTSAPFARASAFGAAVRQFGARPPSGATLRHSPGRTHPPLAQLQFPRFLRPDLASVTRFDLSRVLPSSSETGRHAGRAVAQSRPGADGISARRHRPRSAFQACLPERRPP